VVATETYSRTGSTAPGARKRTGWSRWLPGRRLRVRFSRFAAGSVAATLLSQLTLTGLFWLGGVNATTASLVAFVAGAIPNFIVNWKWTWGRSGRPALLRELLPYTAIIVGGGLAATALTTLTDHVLAPLVTDRGARTITLDIAYLSSYAILFVLKFALLDRVFRNRRTATA
jgi:putative flippase GtrA